MRVAERREPAILSKMTSPAHLFGVSVVMTGEEQFMTDGAESAGVGGMDRDASEARLVTNGIILLTLAARRGGTSAIITTLSSLLNGWAVLVDRYGHPIEAVGAGRVHIDDAISAAMRGGRIVRHPDLQVFPIGRPQDARAYLVVSARRGATSRTRDLATQAAAVLDLTFIPQSGGRLESLARHDVVDVLLSGSADLASSIATRWGLTSGELVVAVLRSRSRSVMLDSRAVEWLVELELPTCVRTVDSETVVILVPEAVPAWRERLARADAERVPVRCGLGRPAAPGALDMSYQQARQAMGVALAGDEPVIEFGGMASVELILRGLNATAMTALVDPIRSLNDDVAVGGGQLLESLRVFLSENGSWEAAASQLGVHRHTLRNRILKIEELTGMSMASPEDRFRAWMAIRAQAYQPQR